MLCMFLKLESTLLYKRRVKNIFRRILYFPMHQCRYITLDKGQVYIF